MSRATAALQSLTRTVIYATNAAGVYPPLDLDALAFWSHKLVYSAALWHIKLGIRNDKWASDLQTLKSYLGHLVPRYRLYSMLIFLVSD